MDQQALRETFTILQNLNRVAEEEAWAADIEKVSKEHGPRIAAAVEFFAHGLYLGFICRQGKREECENILSSALEKAIEMLEVWGIRDLVILESMKVVEAKTTRQAKIINQAIREARDAS